MTASSTAPVVAYFSMEIALEPDIPTYSGGLGVLAGDTLRAAADLGIPMVGISLVHRNGYFRQHLDERGNQTESSSSWSPESRLELAPARVTVSIESRSVSLRAWRYPIRGLSGQVVPVYLLDSDVEDNVPADRQLTDHLYGGDDRYRLAQEVVLGVGGVQLLHALGHEIATYHMNEGHSALLVLGILDQKDPDGITGATPDLDRQFVRRRCVFTTHTPVPAGQDQFPADLVRSVVGASAASRLLAIDPFPDGGLNMTSLALASSRYVNGVALRHGQISRSMFPGYPVNSITNGVHAVTWTADPFRALYDQHIPEWRRDNLYLRYAVGIPVQEILETHAACKLQLLNEATRRSGVRFDQSALTLGFARRATAYKRLDLLFTDRERLRQVVRMAGPLQVLYAGKAHPRDEGGKDLIRRVFEAAADLKGAVRFVYLEEYDLDLARLMCAGSDVWLNTPLKPQEASGTSGMKAALNGVPSLSVMDGWWIEGCVEGTTGWAIGEDRGLPSDTIRESEALYDKLQFVVAPLFYGRPLLFAEVMRSTIALNGSYFNAQRMTTQYCQNVYQCANREIDPDAELTGSPVVIGRN